MKYPGYFAPLVVLPRIVTEPGPYVTRQGEEVAVESIREAIDGSRLWWGFGCRGEYSNGIAESWHTSGRIRATSETANDIVRRA